MRLAKEIGVSRSTVHELRKESYRKTPESSSRKRLSSMSMPRPTRCSSSFAREKR
jgi:hypothetical protein